MEHTYINKNNFDGKFHTLKSLLFNSSHHWVQRGRKTFDVTMGAYDFAEICELVGTFLLLLLRKEYNSNNIGLCHDDRLSVFKNISGQQAKAH